jgi:hypothetical protein
VCSSDLAVAWGSGLMKQNKILPQSYTTCGLENENNSKSKSLLLKCKYE